MPLADAILFKTEGEVIELIHSGADVNESDKYGFRPLIQAVICNKPNVLQVLLEHGADIEQRDILGKTPLQWATDRSELAMCEQLLKAGANPNHYSLDGQPLLVYPILREEVHLVELLIQYDAKQSFAEDFISAKLLGHRFELTGETDIVSARGSFVPLSYEGFYLEFTCELIRRSLNNFIHSMPGQSYGRYQVKISKILRALKHAAQLMSFTRHKDKTPFESTINSLIDTDLLIIPVGYRGHAITFIKYGDLFAHCDRGVNNILDTVTIYRIGNPYILTPEFIKELIFEVKPAQFIEHELKKILALTPLNTLSTKSQLAGNCSWANVEATVPAILFMLTWQDEHHGQRKTGDIKRAITAFYSTWVEWDKDSALEEAIAEFHEVDPVRKISKAMMLGSVLIQRCTHTIKSHIARAKKILTVLVEPEFHFLLKNYRSIYIKKSAKTIGENVIKLLKRCGLDIDTLEFAGQAQRPIKRLTNGQGPSIKMTTALHQACLNGHLASVNYLVEKLHIDVNYQDRTGSTALMYAAWKGELPIIRYLIKQGADVHITNFKGGTAIRYAQYAGHEDVVKYLKRF